MLLLLHIQCLDVCRSIFEAQRAVDNNCRLQILNEKRR